AASTGSAGPAGGTPPPPAPSMPPAPGAPSVAGGTGVVDAAAIRRVWEETVATVGRGSKRAAALVREATVRDVEGDTIVLQCQHAVHATMLSNAPQPLLDAVREVLGGQWQIRCETRDDARGATGPSSAGPTSAGPAGRSPAGSAPSPGSVVAHGDVDWPEPARPGGASPPGGEGTPSATATPPASVTAGPAPNGPVAAHRSAAGTLAGRGGALTGSAPTTAPVAVAD